MTVALVLSPAEDLHQQVLLVHASYRRSERDLAVLLARMADERLFIDLGYASVLAYAGSALIRRSAYNWSWRCVAPPPVATAPW